MRHMIAWRDRAVCAQDEVDAEKFFPTGRPASAPRQLCRECPVRDQCLEFALASPWHPEAIVAGMTPSELHPLWRQRHPDTHDEIQSLLGLR